MITFAQCRGRDGTKVEVVEVEKAFREPWLEEPRMALDGPRWVPREQGDVPELSFWLVEEGKLYKKAILSAQLPRALAPASSCPLPRIQHEPSPYFQGPYDPRASYVDTIPAYMHNSGHKYQKSHASMISRHKSYGNCFILLNAILKPVYIEQSQHKKSSSQIGNSLFTNAREKKVCILPYFI